ncbi:MAG: hypothetical protein Q9228_008045, partial [Teloschistes exilis]
MGDHDPYAEHFDAGHSGKDHTVHQRIRANSSIMELKKILGGTFGPTKTPKQAKLTDEMQSPTEERFPFESSGPPTSFLCTHYEDRLSVHRQKADEAYVIGKRGQYTPVGAYLAGDEIIKIAKQHGVNMIHPGYGFLSENAEFARKVGEAGLIFVGPTADTIDKLGDKVSARKLAIASDVPVVP